MLTRFNNLSLAKKLYGLAAVLLALMTVIAVVAIKNLGSVNDKTEVMYSKHTTSIAEVADLVDTMTDEQRLVLRGLVYADDATIQKEVDTKLAAADAKFKKSLENYKAGDISAEDRAGVDEFEKGYAGYTQVR